MHINMYDETENTVTRYVGFVGENRWDLMITQTEHFYGKSLVAVQQTNRIGILNHDDLDEDKVHLLVNTFGLHSMEEAEEIAEFLRTNL